MEHLTGRNLTAYIVFSEADKIKLSSLIKRAQPNKKMQPVVIKQRWNNQDICESQGTDLKIQ